MTRTTDVYVSKTARPTQAKDEGADIFLSIHFNWGTVLTARGTEYLTHSLTKILTVNYIFVSSVQSATLAAVKASDPAGKTRDPVPGDWWVLKDARFGVTQDYRPIISTIIVVKFVLKLTAFDSVRLTKGGSVNARGSNIKTKSFKDVNGVTFNNSTNDS